MPKGRPRFLSSSTPSRRASGKWRHSFQRRVNHELELNLGFIDHCLDGNDYLVGGALTAADVQMSFVGELAVALMDTSAYANLDAWVARFHTRPAYRAAVERGGSCRFARGPAI